MFGILGDFGEREARHSRVGQCLRPGVLLALFGPVAVGVKAAVPVVPGFVACVAWGDDAPSQLKE
jgi:hypothetical protein